MAAVLIMFADTVRVLKAVIKTTRLCLGALWSRKNMAQTLLIIGRPEPHYFGRMPY